MALKYKAVIPVPLFIILLVVLAGAPAGMAFESPWLLFTLNTLFISVVAALVAYLAAQAYRQTGLRNLLLLGCGALIYGAVSLLAAWFIGAPNGANIGLTVYNTGALFGGLCHLAATGSGLGGFRPGRFPGSPNLKIFTAYTGMLLLAVGLTAAAVQGITAPFFVPGSGPTLLRQAIVLAAALLYAISAVLVLRLYARTKSDFLYWYALGLALIAVGFVAVLMLRTTGSPVNWVGRVAQYLGGLYFLQAVRMARRGNGTLLLEQAIANFFREAESNYRTLVETATDAIVAFDQDGRVLLWNSAAERLFGYASSEAIGARLVDLIAPPTETAAWQPALQSLPGLGESLQPGQVAERTMKHKDGRQFPAELSLAARESTGGWVGIAIIRDISERKEIEAQLRTSLHEKEVLLKEVHHRVKNNLQAIFNLLYLQTGYLHDAQARQVFQDTQSRIKSIALVHEKLYQTGDLAQLNFAGYLESLTGHLQQVYAVDPRRVTIHVSSELESLDLDTAIPLGIITNELVTNALKYAFPPDMARAGGHQICVELRRGTSRQLILSISDNGVGFPEDIDPAICGTLGLQLVSTLTTHMRGRLELRRNGGTTFQIQFTPLWPERED